MVAVVADAVVGKVLLAAPYPDESLNLGAYDECR